MTKEIQTYEKPFFESQLSRLEGDILQAAQWQYPAISLVVYDTALTGSKAVSLLEDRLKRGGQNVVHIPSDYEHPNTIEEEIMLNRLWGETVFFVMHISFNVEEAIYAMLSERSDFFINNRLRIVFWLTEDDFATYIAQMPTNWHFEQSFYTLVDTINWESVWSRIGIRTWAPRKGSATKPEFLGGTPLSEILSLDLRDDPQGLVRRARLLLNFSSFYFQQEESARAFIFAEKAIELAALLADQSFYACAALNMLFLQTKLGKEKTASVYTLQKIIRELERKSASWVLLGDFYSLLFMYDDALPAYKNAVDLDRYNPTAYQRLGEVLLQQQKYAHALDAFQKALDIEQNFSLAWWGQGKVYKVLGRYAKAFECYQSAVNTSYRQVEYWLEISQVSKKETAINAIKRALVLSPKKADLWNALGNIQYGMKNYNEAIRSYYEAINLHKDFGWGYVNLALIQIQAKQYYKAVLLLKKGIQTFENDFDKAHAYYRLGKTQQKAGQYFASAQAYSRAQQLWGTRDVLEHYIDAPGPLPFVTDIPEDDRERKQEGDLSPQAVPVRKTKENRSVHNVLPHKEKLSYRKTLEKVLQTNAQAHDIAYWFDLGEFYIRNRMYDVAEDAYRIAIELEPENAWAYYNLGKAYALVASYGDAIPLFEKSIELFRTKKNQALSWNQLGNVYRRMNEHSLAVAAYERARLLSPEKNELVARARATLLSNCYAQ
jgi:tetratricopeptide (TPR) repeat protein